MNGERAGAAAWRAATLTAAAVAGALVVLVLLSKTMFGWNGDAGLTLVPDRPFVVEVASVSARGAAAEAGVRAGDRIDLRALTWDDRVRLLASPFAGCRITLPLDRAGAPVHATIVPRRTAFGASRWVAYGVLIWMAAFAGFIGWRRAESPEARLLSFAMSCYVAADVLQFLVTPLTALDAAVSALATGGVLGALAFALFVRFAALFGRPRAKLRRALDAVAYGAAGVLALYGAVGAIALVTATIDPAPFSLGTGAAALICGVQLLVVAAGAAAIASARGAERQRVAWAVVSLGSLLVAAVVEIVLDTAVPTTDMVAATQAAVNVAAIVAPVGLTYAVVSRRLLDIGFALNRAAVFSSVSVILVGTFMAIEWALGNWLASLTRVSSTLFALALAIALGFSIKSVHKRVDAVVDHLFFRTRHEHEKALLRFAGEAAFITDADALLRRTVAEVEAHASATSVAVLRRDDRAFVTACASGPALGPFDENDAALVAMRASKSPVELRRHLTAVAGEHAFPMILRADVIGAIVCGAKRGGDAYAPDERAALAALAHSVGVALDGLDAKRGTTDAGVVALQLEVAALRAEVRDLLEAFRLPGPQ